MPLKVRLTACFSTVAPDPCRLEDSFLWVTWAPFLIPSTFRSICGERERQADRERERKRKREGEEDYEGNYSPKQTYMGLVYPTCSPTANTTLSLHCQREYVAGKVSQQPENMPQLTGII